VKVGRLVLEKERQGHRRNLITNILQNQNNTGDKADSQNRWKIGYNLILSIQIIN